MFVRKKEAIRGVFRETTPDDVLGTVGAGGGPAGDDRRR